MFIIGLMTGFSGVTFAQDAQFLNPLVLDLNRDGKIEVVSPYGGTGVSFNQNGKNGSTISGWISPEDGFLVRDLNGNGQIDSGVEMFSSFSMSYSNQGDEKYSNGFQALQQYDANHNGVIDSADHVYLDLKVWQDKNANGITESDELMTLADMGITEISLSFTKSEVNSDAILGVSSYKKGYVAAIIADVWLQSRRSLEIAGQSLLPTGMYSQK